MAWEYEKFEGSHYLDGAQMGGYVMGDEILPGFRPAVAYADPEHGPAIAALPELLALLAKCAVALDAAWPEHHLVAEARALLEKAEGR